MQRLYCGDCLDILPRLDDDIQCIFADPPDNIGLGYGTYKDSIPDEEYIELLEDWTRCFVETAWTVWISFNVKWTLDLSAIVKQLRRESPELEWKPCVQTFTFGQCRQTDLGNNHRPLWRLRWKNAPLYPDQIRVPSWRQLNGDKRADTRGRVPADTFDFPRVTGNSKQRRRWHPTQLHEGLVERCIKLSTREGDTVCDPFAGTGTTLRVCKRLNRPCITMDLDADYCQKIAKEHELGEFEPTVWTQFGDSKMKPQDCNRNKR